MNNFYDKMAASSDGAQIFPTAILRDALLPLILGNTPGTTTYWLGKQLARQFQLKNVEDTIAFFAQAGFGQLKLIKQTEKNTDWELSGPVVEARLAEPTKPEFALEGGFLAEMASEQLQIVAETEINIKRAQVDFTVHLDPKDPVLFPDFDPLEIKPMK